MTQVMRRLPRVKRWVLTARDVGLRRLATYAAQRVEVHLTSALRRKPVTRVEVVVKVFRGEP